MMDELQRIENQYGCVAEYNRRQEETKHIIKRKPFYSQREMEKNKRLQEEFEKNNPCDLPF